MHKFNQILSAFIANFIKLKRKKAKKKINYPLCLGVNFTLFKVEKGQDSKILAILGS